MRCLSLIPLSGIRARLFACWLGLPNLDTINELAEMGFVQERSGVIALHPMIQEISVADLTPGVRNCRAMLDNLQAICLRHGYDISYYKVLFQTIENFINLAEKDDAAAYLLFLENACPYMTAAKIGRASQRFVTTLSMRSEGESFPAFFFL